MCVGWGAERIEKSKFFRATEQTHSWRHIRTLCMLYDHAQHHQKLKVQGGERPSSFTGQSRAGQGVSCTSESVLFHLGSSNCIPFHFPLINKLHCQVRGSYTLYLTTVVFKYFCLGKLSTKRHGCGCGCECLCVSEVGKKSCQS